MRKVIELLKMDILDIFRRPANLLITIAMVFGLLVLTGFVINQGTTAEIVASYSVFICAYTALIMGSMGIMTDRENGLYRMYRSSKLSKKEYILSKTSYTVLSLILAGLVLTVGVLTAEITLSWIILPILLLSIISHIGIGLLVPAFVEKSSEAQRVVQIVFFGMMFIAPVFYTNEGIPEIVQLFQQFIPLTHGIEAMRAVIVNGSGISQIWSSLAILTVLTAISFSIGYRKLEF